MKGNELKEAILNFIIKMPKDNFFRGLNCPHCYIHDDFDCFDINQDMAVCPSCDKEFYWIQDYFEESSILDFIGLIEDEIIDDC